MVAIPDDMEYHGRGPMLSARRIDLNMLWRRAEQILQVCVQVRCLLRYQPYGLFLGLCGAQAGAGVHACATHAVGLESCGLGYTAVQRGIVASSLDGGGLYALEVPANAGFRNTCGQTSVA